MVLYAGGMAQKTIVLLLLLLSAALVSDLWPSMATFLVPAPYLGYLDTAHCNIDNQARSAHHGHTNVMLSG